MEQEATAIDEDDEKRRTIVDHIDSDEDCEQVEREVKLTLMNCNTYPFPFCSTNAHYTVSQKNTRCPVLGGTARNIMNKLLTWYHLAEFLLQSHCTESPLDMDTLPGFLWLRGERWVGSCACGLLWVVLHGVVLVFCNYGWIDLYSREDGK